MRPQAGYSTAGELYLLQPTTETGDRIEKIALEVWSCSYDLKQLETVRRHADHIFRALMRALSVVAAEIWPQSLRNDPSLLLHTHLKAKCTPQLLQRPEKTTNAQNLR